MKKILILSIVAIGMVALMFFSVRSSQDNNKEYPVRISVDGYIGSYSITTAENSKSLGDFSEKEIVLQLPAGTTRLIFASEKLASITKQVNLPQKEDEILEVAFSPTQTAEETLNDIADSSEGTRTTRATYFANDTWLVGNISSINEGIETSVVVSRLLNGEWTTVESGTFIDTELLLENGAPQDLIEYVEGMQ